MMRVSQKGCQADGLRFIFTNGQVFMCNLRNLWFQYFIDPRLCLSSHLLGSIITLTDSFASATILKPNAVSARPNRCVINSFTFTLPARINSIDLAVSSGGPAYDIMTELQLRQRSQRFIGVATFGSDGAKKRIVPPRSTVLNACWTAGGAPVQTITMSARRPLLFLRR